MPVSTGLAIVASVLVTAATLGLLVRRRAGRFRTVGGDLGHQPGHQPGHDRGHQPGHQPGHDRGRRVRPGGGSAGTGPVLASLGVTPGTPVTLLQFSSAFCAPCRTTRLLCADLAARVPGVRHVEVDAESHVDAVRKLHVWRTPTLMIIDRYGQIRRRASGVPTRQKLLTAVAEVMPDAATPPELPVLPVLPDPPALPEQGGHAASSATG